jgi:hypothetical protein
MGLHNLAAIRQWHPTLTILPVGMADEWRVLSSRRVLRARG